VARPQRRVNSRNADGTSNTILLVDAVDDAAVVWTKPKIWQHAMAPMTDRRALPGGIPSVDGRRFGAFVNTGISATTLQAALRARGEVLDRTGDRKRARTPANRGDRMPVGVRPS